MNDKIEELLYEEESSSLDFKKDQYAFSAADDYKKSELLKDILAFANASRRSDAYILIGVEEVKGGRSKIVGINEELDDANLQQFVSSKTQRPLSFEYKNMLFKGKKIAIIKIPVQTRPIYLKKDYGKLKANVVYIRRGSSTSEAEPDEIAEMGNAKSDIFQIHPQINIEFAICEERIKEGSKFDIEMIKLLLPCEKEIPDYQEAKKDILNFNFDYINIDYYRELANYYFWKYLCKSVVFYIENSSQVPASGIKIELCAQKQDFIQFQINSPIPNKPYKRHNQFLFSNINYFSKQAENKRDLLLKETSKKWIFEIEINRLQPQNFYFTEDIIYFYSFEEAIIELEASIYSDNLTSPLKNSLILKIHVSEKEMDLNSILKIDSDNLR